MPPRFQNPNGTPPAVAVSLALAGRRILVVDPSQELPQALRRVTGANITIVLLAMIDTSLIARLQPDVVLSPLFSPDHDILDLARALDKAGYTGPLRAYSCPLPNAALVRAEVRQIWGARDFDILEVPPQWH